MDDPDEPIPYSLTERAIPLFQPEEHVHSTDILSRLFETLGPPPKNFEILFSNATETESDDM